VPIEVVAILARQISSLDMPPAEYEAASNPAPPMMHMIVPGGGISRDGAVGGVGNVHGTDISGRLDPSGHV
jgi:hypothetical protein